jgi:hypothetical protein
VTVDRKWLRVDRNWHKTNATWVTRLARYNDEVAHGLVHTPEWQQQMALLQERYDAHLRELEVGSDQLD